MTLFSLYKSLNHRQHTLYHMTERDTSGDEDRAQHGRVSNVDDPIRTNKVSSFSFSLYISWFFPLFSTVIIQLITFDLVCFLTLLTGCWFSQPLGSIKSVYLKLNEKIIRLSKRILWDQLKYVKAACVVIIDEEKQKCKKRDKNPEQKVNKVL